MSEDKPNQSGENPQGGTKPPVSKQPQSKPQQKQSGGTQQKSDAAGGSKPRRRRYYKNKPQQNRSKPSNVKQFSFKKVSILVPLLNEEESLDPLYNEIRESVNKISCDYEILFIDDGSTDKSLEIIKKLNQKDKKVRYISFRRNYGKSAALHVGFSEITGDAVITMDADLQDDPAEIPNLLAKLEEGCDLVSGWKKIRHDPFIKKHSSKFFNYMTRVMSGIKIHDFNCGLKAYRAEVLQDLRIYGELHRYIPVLAGWRGYRVTEIAVKHHPRRYGTTKFGISRFFYGFVDLITVVFTTRYIKRPLHLFGLLGMVAIIFGFLVNLWLTIDKFFYGNPIGTRPLLFLGVLLMVVGVQFFSVGLLGEIMVYNFQREDEYSIQEKK